MIVTNTAKQQQSPSQPVTTSVATLAGQRRRRRPAFWRLYVLTCVVVLGMCASEDPHLAVLLLVVHSAVRWLTLVRLYLSA